MVGYVSVPNQVVSVRIEKGAALRQARSRARRTRSPDSRTSNSILLLLIGLVTVAACAGTEDEPGSVSGSTSGFSTKTKALNALRPISGTETGQVSFEHPTWGPVTLVTSLTKPGGVGFITVIDRWGVAVWNFNTGSSPWYEMSLNDPATDLSGNIYINWDPGRFNGVTALHPEPDGFADYGTLMDAGNYNGRFYNAELLDTDDDGLMEIVKYTLDCNPSCAEGAVTSETYWWTGSDFQPR